MELLNVWLLAILAGVFNGFAWIVPGLFQRIPHFLFVGIGFLGAGIISFSYMLWTGTLPEVIEDRYWWALGLNTVLLSAAFTLSAVAPRLSAYSLIRPIHSLTPVLMLISGPILIGLGVAGSWAPVSFVGAMGIIIICAGLYSLLTDDRTGGQFIVNLRRHRGVQMIMVVVTIYSITSYFDLIAVQASTPAFYLSCVYSLIGLVCLCLYAGERNFFPDNKIDYSLQKVTRSEWLSMLAFGVLFPIASICHVEAMNIAGHVTHVVAIKEGITAIDAALTLWLISRFAPQLLSKEQHMEVIQLPSRVPRMLVIALGVIVLVAFR